MNIFSDFLRRYIGEKIGFPRNYFSPRRSMGNAKNKRNNNRAHDDIEKKAIFVLPLAFSSGATAGGKHFSVSIYGN